MILPFLSACSPSEGLDNLQDQVDLVEVAATVEGVLPEMTVEVAGQKTIESPPMPTPIPTVTPISMAGGDPITFTADDERIRYIGRFDFRDPLGPSFDWSGSAIEFMFSGTGLTLFLADGRNSYNLLIDDRIEVLETEPGVEIYQLYEELEPGAHSFRITKRTEAYVGAAVFKGVQIVGGSLEDPSPAASRRIEFIGDSITTGYGNEGQSPECWFTPQTQNAEMSYAAITAEALGAEYALIALSGLGVVRNLRAEATASEETAIDFIDRALGLNPYVVWPPGQNVPDAVVINLGTNDYSSVPYPADSEFIDAYVELLKAVRLRHPQASIFAVAGPLMLEPAPWVIEAAVERFRANYDDDQLYYVLVEDNLERSALDFGCDWHPNVNGHKKIAVQLTEAIAATLDW